MLLVELLFLIPIIIVTKISTSYAWENKMIFLNNFDLEWQSNSWSYDDKCIWESRVGDYEASYEERWERDGSAHQIILTDKQELSFQLKSNLWRFKQWFLVFVLLCTRLVTRADKKIIAYNYKNSGFDYKFLH